jgi:hypothetical protein
MKTRPIANEKIEAVLGGFIADGFNRSLRALVKAGALDATKMMKAYKPGSHYYNLVTEQIEYTAKYGAEAIQRLLAEESADESVQTKGPEQVGT